MKFSIFSHFSALLQEDIGTWRSSGVLMALKPLPHFLPSPPWLGSRPHVGWFHCAKWSGPTSRSSLKMRPFLQYDHALPLKKHGCLPLLIHPTSVLPAASWDALITMIIQLPPQSFIQAADLTTLIYEWLYHSHIGSLLEKTPHRGSQMNSACPLWMHMHAWVPPMPHGR